MAWRGARRTYAEIATAYGAPSISLATLALDPISGLATGSTLELRSLPPFQSPAPHVPHLLSAGISAASIGVGQQTGYVPAWAPDGRIGVSASYCNPGGLTIGRSAVGNMGRPFHGPQHVEMRSLTPDGPAYPVIVDDPS